MIHGKNLKSKISWHCPFNERTRRRPVKFSPCKIKTLHVSDHWLILQRFSVGNPPCTNKNRIKSWIEFIIPCSIRIAMYYNEGRSVVVPQSSVDLSESQWEVGISGTGRSLSLILHILQKERTTTGRLSFFHLHILACRTKSDSITVDWKHSV
jgi:hypothetical protein